MRWDANSKEKSLSQKDVVRRTRLYMRMPACITLFEAFRRDLEVIDYACTSPTARIYPLLTPV